MSSLPLVSVVIPTHNRETLVERAVRSALAQTYPRIEVVVIDDASSDGTVDRLSQFASIRVIRLERNLGGAGARNVGIRETGGELVAFLDSDDEWLPNKTSRQVERFNSSNEIGAVYCQHFACDALTARRWEVRDPIHRGYVHSNLLTGWCPRTLSLFMVRREALDAVGGFDESLAGFQDTDLWLRMSTSWQFDAVDEPLTVVYRHLGERLTSNPDARARALDIFLAKWGGPMRAMMGKEGLRAYYRTNMSVALGSRVLEDLSIRNRKGAIRDLVRYFKVAGFSNPRQAAGLVVACLGGLRLHAALKTLGGGSGKVEVGEYGGG